MTTTLYSTLNQTEYFSDEQQIKPLWLQVLDTSQLIMAVLGSLANIITFITLSVNGMAFSPAILFLLRHQSMVDAIACVFATLHLVQDPNWVPGIYFLDVIVCHTWNPQFLYWTFVFVSIWNLVCLAYERNLAVCKPFDHQNLTIKKLFMTLNAHSPE